MGLRQRTLRGDLAPCLLIVTLVTLAVARASARSLLAVLARDEFSSASTTPIPISTVSVWMKRLLSHDETLPQDLRDVAPLADTVAVAPVRRWLHAQRIARVEGLCGQDSAHCNVNEADPVHGLTPLHLAAMSGDDDLAAWLLTRGADPNIMDSAGRKPENLTFANFIRNSKRWAREAGRLKCDLPTLEYADDASDEDITRVSGEVRRLVNEGEPFLMRGALRHFGRQLMKSWNVDEFISQHRDSVVTVGSVPYASAFNLDTSSMKLGAFYDKYVRNGERNPLYVFDKNPDITRPGYDVLSSVVRRVFPVPHVIVDPEDSGGLDGIHYCLGAPGSGAPMHIHGDAVNAVVHGAKRWYIYTPRKTIYSRMPVKEWLDVEYPRLAEEDKPLECLQEAGDVVYIPLDWGHAVANVEENTFGYALELLNRRDTYAALLNNPAAGHDEL